MVTTSSSTGELERITNETLEMIDAWMVVNELQLVPQKTEALIISRRRTHDPPNIRVEGLPIVAERSLKYFGVTLDAATTYRRYLEDTFKRAMWAATAVGRLMLNMSHPFMVKRVVIHMVATSQPMYATSI